MQHYFGNGTGLAELPVMITLTEDRIDTLGESLEDIALQISADPSRANLRYCLERIRSHKSALGQAREQMERAIYDLARSREIAEAMECSSQELEARVYLLLEVTGS